MRVVFINRWEMAGVSYLLSLIIFIYLPGARTSENMPSELIFQAAEHGRLLALTAAFVIGCVLSIIPALAVLVLAKITDRLFQDGSWINQAMIYLGGMSLGVAWPLWVY